VRLPDGGYVWFDVAGVTPSHERKLDEVRDQVVQKWRDAQIADALKKKADDLLAKLKSGTTLADIATAEGLKVETASGLHRRGIDERISADALGVIFQVPKGGVGEAIGKDPTEQIVFRVTESEVPPLDPKAPETKTLVDAMATSLSNDLLLEYAAQVERDIGTSVNQDVLRRIAGGGPAEPE
jgi:peptidyl-prolyl cis-trans isomerase D